MPGLMTRAMGGLSRRLDRPELLAALDRNAARDQHEMLAMRVVLAAALHEESTYVDVGTNRGQVLEHAVRIARSGRHVAFEPIPDLAVIIRKRFSSFRVECHQVAVSSQSGTSSFCHFQELDGWSGLKRRDEVRDEVGRPQTITVDVVTLDDALANVSPTVLKIDVEGAELEVLRGAGQVLAEHTPLILFEHERVPASLYGTTSEAIWDLLARAGYRVFTVTGDGPFDRHSFVRATGTVNWMATAAS